jgi:hypothetical protein
VYIRGYNILYRIVIRFDLRYDLTLYLQEENAVLNNLPTIPSTPVSAAVSSWGHSCT